MVFEGLGKYQGCIRVPLYMLEYKLAKWCIKEYVGSLQ